MHIQIKNNVSFLPENTKVIHIITVITLSITAYKAIIFITEESKTIVRKLTHISVCVEHFVNISIYFDVNPK